MKQRGEGRLRKKRSKGNSRPLLAAQVQTAEQARAALEAGADRVYMTCSCDPEKFQQVEEAGLSVYLALPAYLDDAEVRAAEALLAQYSCFAGVLAGNLAGVAVARKAKLPFVTDLTFNIASNDAAVCLKDLGAEAVGCERRAQFAGDFRDYLPQQGSRGIWAHSGDALAALPAKKAGGVRQLWRS